MPAYAARIYTNTGFDRGNVPGTEAALPATGYMDLDAVYEWQNRYNASIRVKTTWESIKDADYMRLGTSPNPTYYIISNITMLNPNTAQLDLILDPLLTAGGLNALNVVGGQVQRAHTNNDQLFANIIPEPWEPSQRREILHKDTISQAGGTGPATGLNIIICTCDLSKAEEYEAIAAQAEGDAGAVIFPKLPTMKGKSPTYYSVKIDETRGAIYDMPNMWAFSLGSRNDPNQENLDRVAALRSMGIESAIVNSYVLPGGSIGDMSEEQGYIKYVNGMYQEWESQMPFKYYPDVKNNKVFALYNTFSIVSMVSGNSAEFEAHDLYTSGEYPIFILKSDPAPNGTVYCQPKTFQGSPCRYYEQAVAGLPWLSAGVLYEGASGGALTLANAQRRNQVERENQRMNNERYDLNEARAGLEAAAGFFGSAVTGDVGGALKSAVGGANSIIDTRMASRQQNYNTQQRMGDNLFSAQKAAENVAPALAFPVDINASSYFGNSFTIYHTTLSLGDVERFDRFLTAYGYAQDKAFMKSDLTNRQKFNYIKTSGAIVTATYASMRENQQIADMFDSGVRVWHVTPNAAALTDNPIKAGE